MKVETLKCDECGRLQEESNHWIQMYVGEGLIVIGNSSVHSVLSDYDKRDLCGQECALKHIAKLAGWGNK